MGEKKVAVNGFTPKDAEAQPKGNRRAWLLAGGLGLLLGLIIGGLCIALPLSLRHRSNNQSVNLSSGKSGISSIQGTTRTYYLAADKVDWDYAPAGKDLCHNRPFTGTSELYTKQGIGTKYQKGVYRQYTDSSFTVSLTNSIPCCQGCKGSGDRWCMCSCSTAALPALQHHSVTKLRLAAVELSTYLHVLLKPAGTQEQDSR